jgi:LuxR family maltose regulon positive regulatory protein
MEQLERQNLFLHPLDLERRWYRYHHLFADVLRAHLRQSQPSLFVELHQRAVAWYSDQGLLEAAVRHALAGGDSERAARLIEKVAGEMLRQGASTTLIRWLAAVPETVIRARPRLCLARGWTLVWGAAINLDGADECVELARQAALADPAVASETGGEIAALQALIAATRNDMARGREFSLRALEDLPPESAWRGVVALCLGTAYSAFGDLAAAAQAFGEALRLSQAGGMHFVQVTAASFLADLLVFQGQLGRAQEMYERVLAWVDPGLPQKGGVMARGGLAHILYERNQLEAAQAQIQLGEGQLAQVGGAYSAFVLHRVLARIQQVQGNWKDALDTLERSHQLGQAAQVGLVVAQASAWRARLQLAQGDLESAAAWAAHSGLTATEADASHPGWREVEFLTLARVLEAQGKQLEAFALLDRLTEAALAEGRNGSAISILVFKARAKHAQGQTTHALACLEQALALGEPEGYVRTFLDEGQPMQALLGQVTGERRAYAGRLLAAFEPVGSEARPPPGSDLQLLEPLRERELDVLRLMAEGYTNPEIADRLVLGKSTVKTHINRLFHKLDVTSRTQALARARALGLLAD